MYLLHIFGSRSTVEALGRSQRRPLRTYSNSAAYGKPSPFAATFVVALTLTLTRYVTCIRPIIEGASFDRISHDAPS